ncbi:MAG: T9SS type A sorting domain-containing protein [Saprospiraceae bacterium]|nr:T9SS type A sorting domain-containing protein [Saprospiraceae bacterium]
MRKLILLAYLMLVFCGYSHGQEYCNNFKIVSIFDIPPTLQTPGGNYFVLLLTVEEDNPINLDIYADLFFVDEVGDTISIPTGPSSTLPIYATDTIPYILQLNTTNSNQDFPVDFNGELVIIHSSQPVCEVNYYNVSTSINTVHEEVKIDIYPNPFADCLKIGSKNPIENILIFNSNGRIVKTIQTSINSSDINLGNLKSGGYYIAIKFENGRSIVRRILKM